MKNPISRPDRLLFLKKKLCCAFSLGIVVELQYAMLLINTDTTAEKHQVEDSAAKM